jgi:hypothetical protein
MATKKKSQTITIKTDEENPEPMEIIAKSIIEISNAFEKMNNSRLKRRVILLLLRDMTNISISDIDVILNAAIKLKDHFLKDVAPAKR